MGYSIAEKMRKYDYPHGYVDDFPDPNADIEQLVERYRYNVVKLKVYALKKAMLNTDRTIKKKTEAYNRLIEDTNVPTEIVTASKKTIDWLYVKRKEYMDALEKLGEGVPAEMKINEFEL